MVGLLSQANRLLLVGNLILSAGRLSKLVEESHVAFVRNRGGCGNLRFKEGSEPDISQVW